MANVIFLKDRLAQASKRPVLLPGEAKILLFTGVHYERWVDDRRPVSGTKGTKRKKRG